MRIRVMENPDPGYLFTILLIFYNKAEFVNVLFFFRLFLS